MRVKCPHCGVSGRVEGFFDTGKKVKCPKCTKIFIVPDTSGKPSASDWPEAEQPVIDDRAELELQAELEAMLAGTCAACGRGLGGRQVRAGGGPFLCDNCDRYEKFTLHESALLEESGPTRDEQPLQKRLNQDKIPRFSEDINFSVSAIISESWRMTRGVKGVLWGGLVAMLLILLGIGTGIVCLLPFFERWETSTVAVWLNILGQMISVILSIVFLAGLMTIALKRVAGQPFSWRLLFIGFSQTGTIITAAILMLLFITSGFMLLIAPGIYLAVGYCLTLPLIIDKKLGPWEAMEMSRRAIHKQWWSVFGAYLLMCLIYLVSAIPFGVGMIWSIPMFFTLTGILYRLFFKVHG